MTSPIFWTGMVGVGRETMNIILVSERLAKARTITLGLPQLALLGLGRCWSPWSRSRPR